MLVAVSRRLETIIEKYRAQSPDTVLTFARMGGDEFALLLNKLVHEESITKLAIELLTDSQIRLSWTEINFIAAQA